MLVGTCNGKMGVPVKPEGIDGVFLPERLRAVIEETPLKQMALAKAISVAASTVSRWCSGLSAPKPRNVHALAAATGRPVAYFYGSNTPAPISSGIVSGAISVQYLETPGPGGIVAFAQNWRNFDNSNLAREKLRDTLEDDIWYCVCVSPRAFTNTWITDAHLENAAISGVRIYIAYLDLPRLLSLGGAVATRYIEATRRPWNLEESVQEISDKLRDLKRIAGRAARRGRQSAINVYGSIDPHPCLGLIMQGANAEQNRGWGFVSPYLLDSDETAENFGVLFVDIGGESLYSRYLASFKAYFERLQREARR
jgi:transcriptional regulator with XRE-family HTH domain